MSLQTAGPAGAGGSPTKRDEKFWSQKLAHQHSTFGASAKTSLLGERVSPSVFRSEKELYKWLGTDQHGNHFSRVRVAATFGKSPVLPGPGGYDANDLLSSKRESSLSALVCSRPFDHKAKQDQHIIQFNKTIRTLNERAEEVSRLLRESQPKRKKTKKKKSELDGVSVESLQESLLPGPGSYSPKEDSAVKFVRDPKCFMPPRTDSNKSRAVVDFARCEVVESRKGFQYGGSYDLQKDVLKTDRTFTIGRLRPPIRHREVLSVGPGYYDDARAFPFSGPSPLSNGSRSIINS